MEHVAVFVSVVRKDDMVVTLTRIRELNSREDIDEIKSLIKDFILEYKDEYNWQGGYFETIKINPNGDPFFNPIYLINYGSKELEEFNALLK